jgi:tol-pal system protein YbgF
MLALLLPGWGHPARAELRLALVIANTAYPDGRLTAPTADSHAMAKALRGEGFEVVLRESLTKAQMEAAVDEFTGRLTPGAVAMVYYSGRGLQLDGKNYLLPVDADITTRGTIPVNGVDVGTVIDQIAATKSRIRLVVLDACRDDPIQRRLSGLAPGLASMVAPPATVIALSVAPGGIAADNGRYAAELAKALKIRGLPVGEVFQRTQAAVSAATDQTQVPWSVSSVTDSFAFDDAPRADATATPPATVPVRPPPPPLISGAEATELALWLSIKDSKDAAAFENYLARYPTGRYVVLARNSLRVLQQKTALLVQVPVQPVPTFQPPSAVQEPYNAASPVEQQQYDQARMLLRHGNAVPAETAFRRFLADHPGSPLAANAQYWLSESHYVRGNFAEAATAFSQALAAYPKNARTPEILLKLGLSQKALARLDASGRMDPGRKAEACKTLAAVVARFPDAPEAVRAKSQRTQMNCPPG